MDGLRVMSISKILLNVSLAFLGLVLVGCSSYVQTTSGRDYPSEYAEIDDFGGFDIDRQVHDVAAVEPTLRFPARIGLARIDTGDLAAIPAEEAEAWAASAERLGPTFGEFVPVNRLVVDMLAPPLAGLHSRADYARQVIEKIRLGAARQHLDAVLIYQTHGTGSIRDNGFAMADWTVVGAFLLPGRSVDAAVYGTALLVDVRNGYPYGSADTLVERSTLTPARSASSTMSRVDDEARTAAVLALVGDVERMMLQLKEELEGIAAAEGDWAF